MRFCVVFPATGKQNKKVKKEKKGTLTVRRSGRYPRLACAAAIPSARRPPDLGRMADVANPEATAWGEALVLRVLIWIVPTLSSTAMTYNYSNRYEIPWFGKEPES